MTRRFIFVFFLIGHEAVAFHPTHCSARREGHGKRHTTKVGYYVRGNNKSGDLFLKSKGFEEEEFITIALLKNSLVAQLSDESLKQLVRSFEISPEAKKGEKIITQGDSCEGGYVYLIEEGQCRVIVDGKVVPEPYGILGPGALFGDLGILYDSTRAATIEANSPKVGCYQIPGDIFKDVLKPPTESQSWSDMKEIDEAINQVSGTNGLYGGEIILPYKPERLWLWQQFSGTVLNVSLVPTVNNMLICVAFIIFARYSTGDPLFDVGAGAPDQSLPFVQNLSLTREIWEFQKTLTTFILTFFVNNSFTFWKKVYQLARQVQMKLSDFNLLVATNIERNENGTPTDASAKLLDDVASYARLFHIFMWASKSKRFSSLITPEGLQRMACRDIITQKELEVLESLDIPKEQLFIAPLEWMMIRSNKAMADGVLAGDNATKGQLLKSMTDIRHTQASISNHIDGRMPLAYTHLVQILVDTFVFTSPVALYASLGDYSIYAVGSLSLFYLGLNNLAKIFLDPLNNENFQENSIFMDLGVFVRETNVASEQSKKSAARLPFDI